MPVLLAPERAPALSQLLKTADTVGLGCTLQAPDGGIDPRIAGIGSLSAAGGHVDITWFRTTDGVVCGRFCKS